MSNTSFPKQKLKILILENIDHIACVRFQEAGYSPEEITRSLKEDELLEAIEDAHVLCIRSKTKVTKEHLKKAKRLLVIGCFGVGTNQVATEEATNLGIPVFNAPYSSTRSVAELAIGCVIMLARNAFSASEKMHQGMWEKSSSGSYEVREKVIGIVGYGHIGQQVGLLAEALGLQVLFYDSIKKLPLGRARQVSSLQELLKESDFVSLHVPGLSRELLGASELSLMKQGSYLLNFSRGNTVSLAALKEALQSNHLAGAAIDVYPNEPKTNKEPFQCELATLNNVILTPHIGGSTEEAQYKIALEVSASLLGYIESGATMGAVNFPQVNLPPFPNSHRILNIHRNVPGVLSEVNKIISDLGANIDAQHLSTYKEIGYLIMDINKTLSDEVRESISRLDSNLKTRVLY